MTKIKQTKGTIRSNKKMIFDIKPSNRRQYPRFSYPESNKIK